MALIGINSVIFILLLIFSVSWLLFKMGQLKVLLPTAVRLLEEVDKLWNCQEIRANVRISHVIYFRMIINKCIGSAAHLWDFAMLHITCIYQSTCYLDGGAFPLRI